METIKAVRIGQALAEADLIIIGASNGLDMAEGLNLFYADAHFQEAYGDSPRLMASAAYCRGSPLRMQTCDADGPIDSIKRSMSSMSPAQS